MTTKFVLCPSASAPLPYWSSSLIAPFCGIASVADAGSSQSRADLLTVALAVTSILTALIWLSIKPKSIATVDPQGVECKRVCTCLPDYAVTELLWNGEAINPDADKLMQGTLYQGVIKSGAQSFLANLSLYPVKYELPFLPSNTQAVILQPPGDKGIAIIGGDTIRGFTTSDQAWITLIGEKLDSTLSKHARQFQLHRIKFEDVKGIEVRGESMQCNS